jgi:hypothetical protein
MGEEPNNKVFIMKRNYTFNYVTALTGATLDPEQKLRVAGKSKEYIAY